MGSAALVIDNNADDGTVSASSQALTMPASNLLTPHPSERWRSLSNSAYFILDKGSSIEADTVLVNGLTCGENATVRARLSTIDATGVAGDVLDTGTLADGDAHFDRNYSSFVYRLPAPSSWRYLRFDIDDPDATYVEAGFVFDGLAEEMDFNFVPGASIQWIDRSRIATTSSGITLPWQDNRFRRVGLSFDFVSEAQRNGLFERLDRDKGRTKNVLLLLDSDSTNLPRDSVMGLIGEQTPITWGPFNDIFGKQLKLDERI